MMSLTVMPIAQDEANFTKVCRRVESAFNIQKCKVRTLANLQKEGFQSISPTYPANSTVDSIVSRIIPMSTFVGGFPFASSGYNDGRGYLVRSGLWMHRLRVPSGELDELPQLA